VYKSIVDIVYTRNIYVDEVRRVQKVGDFSLSVSIPKDLAKQHHLKKGDSLLFREDVDGTIRLIPGAGSKGTSKATIRVDQIGDSELLPRLIISCYALGYDMIEIVGKSQLDSYLVDRSTETIKRLRGLEIVESEDDKITANSFMDPTKFPVDSLIKRQQILVSRSLGEIIDAIDLKRTGRLEEVQKNQEEVDELYWLIVRQLLVALNRREMASEIGIESPLHASGDRIMTKALEEIGKIILDMSKELMRLKGRGMKMDSDVAARIRQLATSTLDAFNRTYESLRTPDIKLIEESVRLTNRASDLEKEITHEILGSGQYDYSRILVSYFGQLVGYCNVLTEIAFHRLLRKTSRVATIQRT